MFGGMVLITILLAVLAQSVGNAESQDQSNADKALDSRTAARQEAEAIQLEELVFQYEQRLSTMTNIVMNASREDVEKLRRRLSVLKREAETTEEALETNRKQVTEKQKEMQFIKLEIERVETQVKREKAKVESRTLRMPLLQTTDKTPVFLAVKGGSLCAVSRVSGSKPPDGKRGYDIVSVKVESEPGGLDIAEVLVEMGQPVAERGLQGPVVSQVLANVNAANEFLSFAVYPDSYVQFNLVKEFFARKGFEYNWLPMVEDGTIRIAPAERIEIQ